MIPIRLLAILATSIALAGCGGRARVVAPGPEPASWSEASDADSIAAWVVRGCQRAIGVDRGCAERALYSVIEPAGVGKAMAALERILVRAPRLSADAHGLAHGMGIAAYRSPETLGRTFASCPPTQASGCYHGVIQGYFLALKRDAGAVTPEVLNAVCEQHRGSGPLFFQCAHGMGHGVMALEAHHLPRALARCDEVRDRYVRENCYGGAFMENIVGVTHPHHTAEAHAGTADGHAGHAPDEHAGHAQAAPDAHAHHTPAQHAAAQPWKPLDREDLLYPCTALGERYQAQCYEMQSSAAIYITHGNVNQVARACDRAPAAHVSACRASLGRDVAALAGFRHRLSAELCRRTGPASAPDCVSGVASTMVNRAGSPADGIAFCRAVKDGAGKTACYRTVAKHMIALTPAPEARAALCAGVEKAHVAACRAAAALPPSDS